WHRRYRSKTCPIWSKPRRLCHSVGSDGSGGTRPLADPPTGTWGWFAISPDRLSTVVTPAIHGRGECASAPDDLECQCDDQDNHEQAEYHPFRLRLGSDGSA